MCWRYCVGQLRRMVVRFRILMLAGPPGLGKKTSWPGLSPEEMGGRLVEMVASNIQSRPDDPAPAGAS